MIRPNFQHVYPVFPRRNAFASGHQASPAICAEIYGLDVWTLKTMRCHALAGCGVADEAETTRHTDESSVGTENWSPTALVYIVHRERPKHARAVQLPYVGASRSDWVVRFDLLVELTTP